MDLKDMTLISGLMIVNPDIKPNLIEESTFKDTFFPSVKQVSIKRSTKQCWEKIHRESQVRGRVGGYVRH